MLVALAAFHSRSFRSPSPEGFLFGSRRNARCRCAATRQGSSRRWRSCRRRPRPRARSCREQTSSTTLKARKPPARRPRQEAAARQRRSHRGCVMCERLIASLQQRDAIFGTNVLLGVVSHNPHELRRMLCGPYSPCSQGMRCSCLDAMTTRSTEPRSNLSRAPPHLSSCSLPHRAAQTTSTTRARPVGSLAAPAGLPRSGARP